MYKYGRVEFEWEDFKAQENFEKHGVLFSEAMSSFQDENGLISKDFKHSIYESRYYFIGLSKSNRVLTVYYTYREGKIRIIGAAEWRKHRKVYYERAKVRRS